MPVNRTTRRGFLVSVGGAGAAAIAATVYSTTQMGDTDGTADTIGSFMMSYEPSVRVLMTNGLPFEVTVTDLDGNVLEQHDAMTLERLLRLESAYVGVAPMDAPGAA